MGRPKRRYVRDDEVLLRDQTPEDGQRVAIRRRAQKTYLRARYEAATETFYLIDDKGEDRLWKDDGAPMVGNPVFGWAPLQAPLSEDNDR